MDTLIGVVPDTWTRCPLDAVCHVLPGPSGSRLTVLENAPDLVPVVQPKDLRDRRIALGASATTNKVADELGGYRLRRGDVVCSRTGDLGRQALVAAEQAGWLIGSSCLRLRVRDAGVVSPAYLVQYLGHPAVNEWVRRNATGSTVPSVNTATMGALEVVLPPPDFQARVAEVLGALDDKVDVHRRIVETTAELHGAVLLSLLSWHPGP
ncbi:MAG TPA: restriction endonuclease subunit S [Pseudonocardiaceae bacterium]